MRIRFAAKAVTLAGALFILSGCGENNNFFNSLADKNSTQAKLEEAQYALDKGDCTTAINGFTSALNDNSGNVDTRIDLAAAYMCRAGFSVSGFVKVAADFDSAGTGMVNGLPPFQAITAQVSSVIPNTTIWKGSVCTAKEALQNSVLGGWPCPVARDLVAPNDPIVFGNDPDAGFILSIVNLIDATLVVADVLNTLNGLADCTDPMNPCDLTAEDLVAIGTSLVDSADAIVAALVAEGLVAADDEVAQTISDIVANMDTSGEGTLGDQEIIDYIVAQGIVGSCAGPDSNGDYSCS